MAVTSRRENSWRDVAEGQRDGERRSAALNDRLLERSQQRELRRRRFFAET